jgi:putative transcriptional regulator
MGLVLSRPTEALAGEVVPELEDLVEPDALLFVGGPVEPGSIVVLAEFDEPSEAARPVIGDIGFLPGDRDHGDLGTRRARVFAGYAGWGPGQLEAEIEESSWILEEAEPDDLFAAEPDDLWADVLRRKGGPFAVLSTMPADPSLN